MRHLKSLNEIRIEAEKLSDYEYFNVGEEVVLLRDYLRKIVKEELSPDYGMYVQLENEFYNNDEKTEQRKTFSIVMDVYNNYFIFQLDYKKDGFWIKYLNSCHGELKIKIDNIKIFFDAIANKHTEYGWRFDINKFIKEFNNIDVYISSGKYNI